MATVVRNAWSFTPTARDNSCTKMLGRAHVPASLTALPAVCRMQGMIMRSLMTGKTSCLTLRV